MKTAQGLRERRKQRVRYRIAHNGTSRPRLSVFRSGRHIHVQIIDDQQGRTLAAASTVEKDLRKKLKTGANKAAAKIVGDLIAQRAKTAGLEKVVFDRGNARYHGCIKILADAAREGGLSF